MLIPLIGHDLIYLITENNSLLAKINSPRDVVDTSGNPVHANASFDPDPSGGPLVRVVVKEDIAASEELWVYYGAGFWGHKLSEPLWTGSNRKCARQDELGDQVAGERDSEGEEELFGDEEDSDDEEEGEDFDPADEEEEKGDEVEQEGEEEKEEEEEDEDADAVDSEGKPEATQNSATPDQQTTSDSATGGGRKPKTKSHTPPSPQGKPSDACVVCQKGVTGHKCMTCNKDCHGAVIGWSTKAPGGGEQDLVRKVSVPDTASSSSSSSSSSSPSSSKKPSQNSDKTKPPALAAVESGSKASSNLKAGAKRKFKAAADSGSKAKAQLLAAQQITAQVEVEVEVEEKTVAGRITRRTLNKKRKTEHAK